MQCIVFDSHKRHTWALAEDAKGRSLLRSSTLPEAFRRVWPSLYPLVRR